MGPLSIDWLYHLLVPLAIGFIAAVFNCIAKKHGFSMDCVYEGVGFMGGTMGLWLTALFHTPPGKVMVPAGSDAAAQAARDAQSAAKKAADAGSKNSGLNF